MKKDTHPQYFKAKAVCSCGNTFEIGATVSDYRLEICSNCHPMYTGKMKMVDTAGRLDRFKMRLEKAQTKEKTN
ncbi:50S ribosomal protein L31 [Candidatus Berkelbacteria bacterium]|nr:50S ribosomal protein L31 [Candidatus Berkelbacteria bacterium]